MLKSSSSDQVKNVAKNRLQEYLKLYYNNNQKTKIPFNYDQELVSMWAELLDCHRKHRSEMYEVLMQ
jgi:hypothetical protein